MEASPPSATPTPGRWAKVTAFARGWKQRPLLTLGWVAVFAVLMVDHFTFMAGIGTGIGLVLALALGLWKRRLWAWMPFVALGFACIHGWRLQQTYEHPLRKHLLSRPERPERVSIQGRLYPWTEGAELDAARAVCEVSALSWGDAGNDQPTAVRVKVALPDGYKLEKAGVYEITGLMSLPKQPMNPGQFNPVDYSLRNGWVAYVQAQTIELKAVEWSPTFHLLYWAERSRQWITAALSRGIADRKEDTAVLLAMALGASDAAGEDIEDAFRDSGTLHIFAVSGLHVVMLAVVLSFGLRWLGMGKSRSVILLIIIVFAYAYITGWRPSAARAAFMIAVVMAAIHWNRKSDVQNSLGLALLVLLIWDSHQLFQPGFQLSFLVLWAISAFAAPMLIKLQPWTELDPFFPPSLASWSQWLGRWSRRQVAALACTSLAAWIGSLPLTLGHFHTVTPVGLLANLLLVPMSGFSIGVSCVSLLAAGFGLGTLQVFANWINAWMARAMVVSAGWFAGLPGANVTLDLRFEKAPPPMEMQVFHLPGGGSAGHVRVQDKHWLIDTGNVRPWRNVMRPFFRHQGINTLDGVLLTHGDSSHVGAVPLALLMNSPRIITSVHEPWMLDSKLTSFQELSRRLEVDSLAWHRHQADDVIPISTGSITVLHPQQTDHYDKADDRGLVLMLHLGQIRVLWLGDAGFITEKRLLERGLDLRCDVLVRGQHPTDPGGLPEFLIAAQPSVVISANDSRYIEEAIPQRVRDFCTQRKIPHFDLEVSGSVKIGITSDGARLRTHRSGEEIFLPARPR
jgi:competence protein ComEC